MTAALSTAPQPRIVTAAVLVIGNEILSGRTKDANLNYLAIALTEIGIRLMEARVVPDIEATIIAAVNELRARYDYVFTTGGIGPTHDDITAASIAKAFGLKLIRDERAVDLLTRQYGGPEHLTEARLRMAHVPEGAVLIDNPVSAAPGFQIGNVYVLAGVPRICQAMFDGLKGRLQGGDKVLSVTVSAHIGEGVIAKDLGLLQDRYSDLDIGSYPYFRQGRYGASFVMRGTQQARLEAAAVELRDIIRRLGAEPIDGEPAA
ncbi:competence/damage-inducible protein A [Dongia soli]|uniref:Molybdopterin-binding protein n=1 Tax=Dongia soli TaxID=600628 RepID=A0ABU5EIV9_9PROT|nr:molybdopterin-binding protein [Dongia soli]MDY0885714.1 molybdopterin-binding protein [Dongia soli]